MAADPIDRYLQALRRRLPKAVALTEQTLVEAERELRAAASRIEAGGLSAERAAAEAVARAPGVDALAARFALDAPATAGAGWPLRLGLSLSIAASVLLCLAAARAGLLSAAPSWALLAGLLVLTLAVAVHGALAAWLAWSGGGSHARRSLVFLGGLGLLMLGGFQGIWTLYLAAGGGAGDWLAAAQGCAVALQGGLGAWSALPRVWSPWLE